MYEKQREYQERARLRQIQKAKSPEYKAKQRAAQERALQRKIQKVNTPEYKAKQLEKQKLAAQRRYEKAKGSGFKSISSKPAKPMKTKGMAGRTRTSEEVVLHDSMAALGCICCINKGLIQPFSGTPVSIHHIDGRTKEDAHKKALPLCSWHHDVPIPQNNPDFALYPFIFPIHAKGRVGGRVAWETENGKQEALLEQVMNLIA